MFINQLKVKGALSGLIRMKYKDFKVWLKGFRRVAYLYLFGVGLQIEYFVNKTIKKINDKRGTTNK